MNKHPKPTVKHGHAGNGKVSPEYHSWVSMIKRCASPGATAYERYGGRGVIVCERWRQFENFLADMGQRPEGTNLDRINNLGNYEPGNCRWATPKEQARNRRSNKSLTLNGETKPLSAWAEQFGLCPETIGARLKRGWPPERAVGLS